MCNDNKDNMSVGFSDSELDIELMDEHLLEPIPQEKGETVSVQGSCVSMQASG